MIVFAHGLEGSPEGRKPAAFRDAGLPLIVPDGRRQPLAARVEGLIAALEAHPRSVLVGSSYGGLAALWLAATPEHAQRITALVLLAPALNWREPPADDPDALCVPEHMPATVIHGIEDPIVPIEVSRRLSSRSPHIERIERDDGHRLAKSLDVMVATVKQYINLS